MKTTRVVMCVVMSTCLAVVFAGCSGNVDIPRPDESSLSPEDLFFAAAANGDVGKLKSLLATDPTLIGAYGPEGTSPLHTAAFAGQNEAVQFLLEQGADPMLEDENGNTPLNVAVTEGHEDTAKIMTDAMEGAGGGAAAP